MAEGINDQHQFRLQRDGASNRTIKPRVEHGGKAEVTGRIRAQNDEGVDIEREERIVQRPNAQHASSEQGKAIAINVDNQAAFDAENFGVADPEGSDARGDDREARLGRGDVEFEVVF